MLTHAEDISIVALVSDAASLAAAIEHENPDAVIVAADELLDSLDRYGNVPAMLLLDDSARDAAAALAAGAKAVLPADSQPDEVRAALRAIVAGLVVLHPADTQPLLATAQSLVPAAHDTMIESLTTREREVLAMLADGLSNKEIAARLGISDHTVKFHVGSLLGKLGASTRTEAVTIGIRQGLVSL